MNAKTKQFFADLDHKRFAAVEQSLAAGFDITAKNEYGQSALHVAAQNSDAAMCRLLLANGAKVNERTLAGESPLHCSDGQQIIMTLIEAGAEIEARDGEGKTPLHIAARAGRTEEIVMLLYYGADMQTHDGDDQSGYPAACHALSADEPHGALAAFKIAGFDFAGVNHSATPLHYAVEHGKAALVPWLMKNGANPAFVDENGRTPRELLDHCASLFETARGISGFSRESIGELRTAFEQAGI